MADMVIMRRLRLGAVGLFASLLALAGCGDSSGEVVDVGEDPDVVDRAGQLPESGEPDAPFAGYLSGGGVAGLGDALVVLDTESGRFAESPDHTPESFDRLVGAAIRLEDGTWVELPDPPNFWNAAVVKVGHTVGIVGFDCGSEVCAPSGVLLAEDLDSWQDVELGGGEVAVSADLGMAAVGGGFFAGPGGYYHLDAAGAVVRFGDPQLAMGSNFRFLRCVVGSEQLVWVELRYGEETVREIEDLSELLEAPPEVEVTPYEEIRPTVTRVVVFDRERADAGWAPAALPTEAEMDRPALLCGPGGPILVTPDTEYRFDDGRWLERSVVLPDALSTWIGRDSATGDPLDDGTVLITTSGGIDPEAPAMPEQYAVLRHPDGRYEPVEPWPGPPLVIDGDVYRTSGTGLDQIVEIEFE